MAGAGLGTAFRHLRGLFGGRSVVALEDGQLLARYEADGDEAAFEALIGRHGPMVLTICRAVLRNEHDVEDAFQATFMILARRAGSIRGSDALGGWLHRVAYRASVQASVEEARRRRKEAEAAMSRRDASGADRESELAALLHEEIDRLPESHRLPVVLCDLEGLTYEQAAEQLRWTVPTLRNRLAKARQRLKDRLARPGIAPLASVPPALARTTLSAVTGGQASAGAALLTHALLRGMFMTKLKLISTAALAALALASAGVFTYAGQPADDPKPATEAKAGAVSKPEPAVDEPAGLVEIRGIVVDPAGKPVAGAKVWASIPEPARETTCGPDGRFRLKVPPPDPRLPDRVNASYPRLVASAPGFGLGFLKEDFETISKGESTIRLVEDNPPIEGKIIDIEGRPVAGAKVQVRIAWVANRLSFGEWVRRAKGQVWNSVQSVLQGLSTSIEAETGADGRFTLTGIGRDRVATLLITGPTIASTEIKVMTSDDPEIQVNPVPLSTRVSAPRSEVFHARKFEGVAGPTRPIEGVVRDKDTGRGIEGVTVRAAVLDPRNQVTNWNIVAHTDSEGRYRLLGMPSAPSYRLFIEQTPGRVLPYVGSVLRTPVDSPAVGPIRFDVALKRGFVVRGRVTDKATGRPVTGFVDPYILPGNPAIAEFPDWSGNQGRPRTDLDGRFEIATLPGPGLLAFRADRDEYVNAIGFETIAAIIPPWGGQFPTHRRTCVGTSYHVLTALDLDPKAGSATIDLQVDSGRSVDLNVVDAEGRPVDGLKAIGMTPLLTEFEPQESSIVKVRAIDPSRPRRVYVYQLGRKLAGSIWLKGNEVGPLTVRLVPWGTIVGRFLDAEGNPLASQRVGLYSDSSGSLTTPEDEGLTRPSPDDSPSITGKDGRFRIEALVPGLRNSFSLVGIGGIVGARDVVVAPGEVKDLGDIKAPPPRR